METLASDDSVTAFADAWDVSVDLTTGDDLQLTAHWWANDTSTWGAGSGHEFGMKVTSIPGGVRKMDYTGPMFFNPGERRAGTLSVTYYGVREGESFAIHLFCRVWDVDLDLFAEDEDYSTVTTY